MKEASVVEGVSHLTIHLVSQTVFVLAPTARDLVGTIVDKASDGYVSASVFILTIAGTHLSVVSMDICVGYELPASMRERATRKTTVDVSEREERERCFSIEHFVSVKALGFGTSTVVCNTAVLTTFTTRATATAVGT